MIFGLINKCILYNAASVADFINIIFLIFQGEVSGLQNPFCALNIPSWCLEKVR